MNRSLIRWPILLMLVGLLGCASYPAQEIHLYEGSTRSLSELATIRLGLGGGSLISVDGIDIPRVKVYPTFIYVLPGEREIKINCAACTGKCKSPNDFTVKIEEYSIDLKAGWLYRLEIAELDPENNECVYTYKFAPYAPGMQEGLKPK